MNSLFLCCSSTPWIKVSEKLQEECGIKLSYFVGWKFDSGFKLAKEKYSDCFFQEIEDSWKGVGFPNIPRTHVFDENLAKKTAYEELIAIRMMDRLDPTLGNFTFTHRQQFFRDLLLSWLDVVDFYRIEVVIASVPPHRVFDYALYLACKIKKILFISYQGTPFRNYYLPITSVDEVPNIPDDISNNFPKSSIIDGVIDERISVVKKEYVEAEPIYMKSQVSNDQILNTLRKALFLCRDLFLRRLRLSEAANTYFVRKDMMPSESIYSNFRILCLRAWNRLKIARRKRIYEDSVCPIDFNCKYVFVAFHYQPEETSCPTGGAYVDQLLILEMLDRFLDDDVSIYVKEHRSQFCAFMEEGAAGRSRIFYERLFNMSNRVKVVSAYTDPFSLIDKAIATVTISGTVGWESVVRGTPALVFGRAWYEGITGVFRIKDLADLEKSWPRILQMKKEDFSEDLLGAHRRLSSNLVHADIYKTFSRPLRVSEKESVCNIVENIKLKLSSVDGDGCVR